MFPLKKALAFVIFDESNLIKTGSGNQLIKLQLSAGLVLFLGLWKRLAWDRLRPAALSGAVRLPCRWELLSRCWAAFDLGISWLYHHWAAGEKCSFLCPTITWDGWQTVLIPYRVSKRSREVYIKRSLWISLNPPALSLTFHSIVMYSWEGRFCMLPEHSIVNLSESFFLRV